MDFRRLAVWIMYGGSALVAVCGIFAFYQKPISAAAPVIVTIEEGSSIRAISETLKEEDVIISPRLFRATVRILGASRDLRAGQYVFESPQSTVNVARRIARGAHGISPVRVVFPEGTPVRGMGAILDGAISEEEARAFVEEGESLEGYLFPDTYFILPTATSGEVIQLLSATFDERTEGMEERASSTGRTWHDVVVMASIIEEEVQTNEDKQIVSGILWKRLDEGMALQVDAPFVYILGKTSADLTRDDLAIDSPFNTYLYTGLPPSPISNPGLESIEAALTPTSTDYWFYLSDDDGAIHYAEDYDAHLDNKALYID